MSKKLNLTEKLDFENIDLTAPDKVVGEIISELSDETNGIIHGKIASYEGQVVSYTKRGIGGIASVLSGEVHEKNVTI